jgi:hypothetical protein
MWTNAECYGRVWDVASSVGSVGSVRRPIERPTDRPTDRMPASFYMAAAVKAQYRLFGDTQ